MAKQKPVVLTGRIPTLKETEDFYRISKADRKFIEGLVVGRKPKVVVRSPVPTAEKMRIKLGMSKNRSEKIRKIMETPVPRRKRQEA